jgi:alkylation response protein AidB-like acyl-CoA dehydrogenase
MLEPSEPNIVDLEELGRVARDHAAAADERATLSPAVVERLFDLGLFRLWIPRRYGGLELDLPRTLAIYESVARADGSVGWAVMIGAGGGLFAAWLEPAHAGEIFGPRDAVIAGSGSPEGRAERVAGGYRVRGRWRYASGADYATTFTANCLVTRNGVAVEQPDGSPLVRAMAFDRSEVTVLRTWNTNGMRGTGSHDFEVRDVLVPERRSFSVLADAPREPGPLYRLPFGVLTELPIAAVALGIARHALVAFSALAERKRSADTSAPLSEDPTVRLHYAGSHARWTFARAGIEAIAGHAWDLAVAGRALAQQDRAEITAASGQCVAECIAAVSALVRLAGMTGIEQDDALARAWRDLQALAAHVAVSPKALVAAGGVLIGAQSPALGQQRS